MAAMIRSSNCMPPRRGDILRLLSRHGRFRMQQTGGTVLIGVTYSGNERTYPFVYLHTFIYVHLHISKNCIIAFVATHFRLGGATHPSPSAYFFCCICMAVIFTLTGFQMIVWGLQSGVGAFSFLRRVMNKQIWGGGRHASFVGWPDLVVHVPVSEVWGWRLDSLVSLSLVQYKLYSNWYLCRLCVFPLAGYITGVCIPWALRI